MSVEMACNTVVVTVVVTLWVTLAGRLAGGQAGHMGQEVVGRSQAVTIGTTGGERVGGMLYIATMERYYDSGQEYETDHYVSIRFLITVLFAS